MMSHSPLFSFPFSSPLFFQASNTSATMTELRLADHFPRNPKPCRTVAEKFFACFSEKGLQPPGGVSMVYE